MSTIIKGIKTNKLLSLVILSYLSLLIFNPDKSYEAFANSLYYVKEMLLIMPIILLLTSLIEAWVPKKTIENNFGENSGIRGSIFSFLLGSFSAGPIYAAFPVCKALLKKGANVSNIVIILSTWAVIKIPMLANESKFLGPKFMAVRWILTTISIFLMGYITSKIVKKDEIIADEINSFTQKEQLIINEECCMGCGLCTKIAPDYFMIENKKAKVKNKHVANNSQVIKHAVEKCPAKVIEYLQA